MWFRFLLINYTKKSKVFQMENNIIISLGLKNLNTVERKKKKQIRKKRKRNENQFK